MIDDTELVQSRMGFWQRWHPYVLHSKGLITPAAISKATAIDMATSLVVAHELVSLDVDGLLDLLDLPSHLVGMVRSLSIGDAVNHLGYRIWAPMDVYLEMLPALACEHGWAIIGTKRFAPSRTFQDRVGATAEMAQVWLRLAGTQVELELFDIHKRLGGDLDDLHRLAAGVLDRARPVPGARGWAPFQNDEIWHYGVLFETTEDVAGVHRSLLGLTAEDSRFVLRNQDVVVNAWHGSHHTKLANAAAQIEIEFLAYSTEWQHA